MDDVKINTSKTISLALGADPDSSTVNATLYHEFADSSVVQVLRRVRELLLVTTLLHMESRQQALITLFYHRAGLIRLFLITI